MVAPSDPQGGGFAGWAHLPREVLFDRSIAAPAKVLCAALHTLAVETNPEAPATLPMTPTELRRLVGLLGKSQFHLHLRSLRIRGLLDVEALPGGLLRVRPLRVLSGRPENRMEEETPLFEESMTQNLLNTSPENRTASGKPDSVRKSGQPDPELVPLLRQAGVASRSRTRIALLAIASVPWAQAHLAAARDWARRKGSGNGLALAVRRMLDGDPAPEVCPECGWSEGEHTINCATRRQQYASSGEAEAESEPATLFLDSPDVGPDCLCSACGLPILEGVPIRVFSEAEGGEYRYHPTAECAGAFGLLDLFSEAQ